MKVDTAQFVRAVQGQSGFPKDDLPEFAFAGRSNVGKSSLLNRLLGRKSLARVSSSPGRTRAVNYFLVNSRIYFVDLPGYGYAKVSKQERLRWARLMELYFSRSIGMLQVFMLVDAKAGATPLDVNALEYLRGLGCEPTVVATKIDRIPRGRRKQCLEDIRRALSLADGTPIPFSARSGEGVNELWKVMTARLCSRKKP